MSRLNARGFYVPVLLEYIAKAFVLRFIFLLVGLTATIQTLDILSETGALLDAENGSTASIFRYGMLRLPYLISTVTTFAALLATLMTCASLAQHSEVVIIQSAGLSAFRIVLPMIGVCAVVAFMHFFFHENVVVHANAEFEKWKDADYSMKDGMIVGRSKNVTWATEGDRLISADTLTKDGTILDNLRIIQRNSEGVEVMRLEAGFAHYKYDRAQQRYKWYLHEVTRHDLSSGEITRLPGVQEWRTALTPDRFAALAINPEQVSFWELQRTYAQLRSEGTLGTTIFAWLHQKIAAPLTIIIMPLLGCVAAFGVIRSGAMFRRVLLGLGLGFAFIVVDNFLIAIGQFGTVPPVLAAWAPLILFGLVGTSILIYTEE